MTIYKHYWLCVFAALLIASVLVDLCIDKVILSPLVLLRHSEDASIMFIIRLPRVLTALLIGVIMGMCGTIMQTITRNPLASPYILGISSGAGLGAALATFGISFFAFIDAGLAAFIGAIAVSIPVFICIYRRSTNSFTLILMGVAISSICNAGISLAQYFATPDQLQQYVFWSMGDVQKNSSWKNIFLLIGTMLPGLIIYLSIARDLDILSFGSSTAKSLGINPRLLIGLSIILVSFQTAVAVSIAGIIGFIGLVSPHIVRAALGQKNKFVIIGSGLLGGSLLVMADFFSHIITYPVRFPIGAITAIIGAPVFLWIIFKPRASQDD
jgi:iron complex transport system permease protein